LHFDYTTIGHVTVDVLEDGSRQPGGSAFYSALQAARLGARTLVITRGVPAQLEELLAPYSTELELHVVQAAQTTTLATRGARAKRTQRMLAWAGALPDDLDVESEILHIAPVAREAPAHWRGSARFLGLTPQGLVRTWQQGAESDDGAEEEGEKHEGAEVSLTRERQRDVRLAARCHALVISERERASCTGMIRAALAAGGWVAITAEERPVTLLAGDREPLELALAERLERPRDDLGAGDVFAAALFLALAEARAPEQAAALAAAAAAVRLRGVGAAAVGRRAEIEAQAAR
jgi:sugar/nucleoside kinase (ribokinase family)